MDPLSNHPAFKQLDEGRQQLGLEQDVAKELIRYLIVKRALLSGDARCQATAQSMSPSAGMDELWHWMLLNTHVRDEVHKLVGGDVPHSTETAADPEFIKQHRRSVSQTAMSSFGFSPNPNVWSVKPFTPTFIPKPPAEGTNPTEINVYVKTLTGKSIRFRVSSSIRVEDFKRLIQNVEGMPPDQQRLIFAGQQFEDSRPLDYYTNIRDGVTIHLVQRLSGC